MVIAYRNIATILSFLSLFLVGCGSNNPNSDPNSDNASKRLLKDRPTLGQRSPSAERSPTKSDAISTGQAALPLPDGPPLSIHDRAVPILMYHVIKAPAPGAPYPGLWVAKGTFASHMQTLAANGYCGVTLDQLWEYWRTGIRLPHHPVVITFDDGYNSVITNAFPVLRKLRWPAVLNLEVRGLHEAGDLTEQDIRTLIAAGWELDSHTIDHIDVSKASSSQLRHEIGDSRRQLQSKFGVPVDFFAYPSGRYSDNAIRAVRAAGYRSAVTTMYGLAKRGDPYRLARVRVDGKDSAKTLISKLKALAPPQID
jgi:peptidoglycan/xylan/chitin deacetylase (PgdA/CDA1 family)